MATKIFVKRNILLGLILVSTVSCSIKKMIKKDDGLLTKSLYMQSKFPRIEFPPNDSIDSQTGGSVISEQVDYTHPDNVLTEKKKKATSSGKLSEVQNLDEVVVTAKSRFTPEHNGKVDVDFVIKVPKEMLSPGWRVTLKPKLMHNDSIVYLDEIILKGRDFDQMQKKDYADYSSYLESIIDKSKYDSAFLDRKNVEKDIRNMQTVFYGKYNSDWKKQKDYLKELSEWEKKQAYFTYRQRIYLAENHPLYARKAYEEKTKRHLMGKDTTGIYARYMAAYKKKTDPVFNYWEQRKIENLKLRPHDGKNNNPLHNVPSQTVTKKDSVNMAKNRYDFKEIAVNEIKSEQKQDVFHQMVKYPYEEHFRLDTIVNPNQNFVYSFRQRYPIVPGLKKIRIFMDTKVDAVDQSSFVVQDVDTLSYFIASLAQLADPSLAYKVSNLTRIGYNLVTAYIKYPSRKSTFSIDYKDNKDQVHKVLEFLDAVQKNKVYALDSAVIEVSRSLDGGFEENLALGKRQAEAFKGYLKQVSGDSVDVESLFKTASKGEDWNALVKEIQASQSIKNKQQILDILTNATSPDVSEEEIKRKYKSDYAIIVDSIYPRLARTDVTFHLRRTDMTEDKEVRKEYKGEQYEQALALLQEREYWKALQILSTYGDYNTALCLACLGYNAKAYELLMEFPKDASNEYLLAILSARLNREAEAVEHLSEAFKLDSTKRYRISVDPEVSALVQKYDVLKNR
jgi:hypothetical protein